MHKFVRSLITEWRRLELPFTGETAVVAVSGGADSTALLLALADLRKRKKLNHRLVAAHFNHKLRSAESDADEQFVHDLAASLDIECVTGKGRIAGRSNIEKLARDARYAFLARTAATLQARFVLTAHTINDQAETFLINLIRGSGPDGLSAMRPIRPLWETKRGRGTKIVRDSEISNSKFEIQLVRPLLSWARRQDTEEFCFNSAVEYRRDAMNDDPAFLRVRIRRELIPVLAEYNPKIIETLARTAHLVDPGLPETDENPPKTLRISDLVKLTPAGLRSTIRSWLRHRRGHLRAIELKHIEAVERLVNSRKSGRTAEMPGFGRVNKSDGRLTYEQIVVEK